ncbi:MAG: hypothetical protein CYG60_16900 [Actinobacteria bacterium]|nr:MAG: hypothetical protein CYG60_16900 [Actinomycetota bacterium]
MTVKDIEFIGVNTGSRLARFTTYTATLRSGERVEVDMHFEGNRAFVNGKEVSVRATSAGYHVR